MTQLEFQRWQQFYLVSPFDDLHRYHRPAALVAKKVGGGDIEDLIEWLQPRRNDEYSSADLTTLRAFGFSPPRQ